ncbi:MAG TPA: undecaprenyl-diphosphate phosphatase [Methylomirabilota bacterium]|nr:undecaprenyl-diphosphate phosphatase [Methylomirabilota bacterium]
MTYVQGLVLGLVQGLTEFLPISSSGHLILVPHVLGWPDQGLAVDAALHLGTLAALVAYFRAELAAMLVGGGRRLGVLLVAATVPAALAGLALERTVEATLRAPVLVAASTAFWAGVMWMADRRAVRPRPGPEDPLQRVSWRQGLGVGVAQALALIPGTSRSGVTITAGLLGGMDRATAARFGFLLGIPVTAGAGLLETLHLLHGGLPPGEAGPLLLALGTAFASGWFAVWFLVGYLRQRSLLPFVLYRLVLAAVIVAVTAS